MPLLPIKTADLKNPDRRMLARALTMVENDLPGSGELLASLDFKSDAPVTGITGPPGAGKSTLIDALIEKMVAKGASVAVLAVDPTSPFSHGSLLADRIRMGQWHNHPQVYIRSVATRGSLGGLSAKAIEMTDILKHADFDHVFIETVGIGQSEVEVAGLADQTLLVLIPGSGDEIQHIKSGIMEVADAFVINKADLEGAAVYAAKLEALLKSGQVLLPVFQTVAQSRSGIGPLIDFIGQAPKPDDARRLFLLAEKAYMLIRDKRMHNLKKEMLRQELGEAFSQGGFNLYRFTQKFWCS